MKFIKFLTSGEVVFFLFLVAGVFKEAFENIPIDLTLFFMFWSMLIAGKRIIRDGNIPKYFILPSVVYGIFAIFFIFSLFYTPGQGYALDKTLRFFSLTSWAFIAPFILIRNKASLDKFLNACIFASTAVSLYVLYQYFTANNVASWSRIGVEGGNVLGLARLAGLGVISIVVLFVYRNVNLRYKLMSFAGIGIISFTLLLTGSRMPLLSMIITLILLFPLSFKFKKQAITYNKGIFSIVIMLIITCILLIPFKEKIEPMVYRLHVLISEDGGGASVSGRTDRYETAFDMWKESMFFGKGVGSFPLYYSGLDEREYAHNIFLEVLSELGLVGFLPLVLLLVLAVWKILHYRKYDKFNLSQLCVLLLTFFMFLNINVTGDINDNRVFFTLLSTVFMIYNYKENEKLTISDVIQNEQTDMVS